MFFPLYKWINEYSGVATPPNPVNGTTTIPAAEPLNPKMGTSRKRTDQIKVDEMISSVQWLFLIHSYRLSFLSFWQEQDSSKKGHIWLICPFRYFNAIIRNSFDPERSVFRISSVILWSFRSSRLQESCRRLWYYSHKQLPWLLRNPQILCHTETVSVLCG